MSHLTLFFNLIVFLCLGKHNLPLIITVENYDDAHISQLCHDATNKTIQNDHKRCSLFNTSRLTVLVQTKLMY
jgi:hypothetical protein